jgi:hypothetical protein
MPNHTCCFVSLAIASIDVPASEQGALPATSHLAAIAMFIAERDRDGAWSFFREQHAIAAGESEDVLLAWATQTLPNSGVVLGWQLAEAIVPPLLDAGGDPEIGRAFLDRLMKLVTAPSIDLAIPHGGAGAPLLAGIAGEHGISAPAATAADVESAWAFGNVQWLRDHVAARAIATWRLRLAEANGTAGAASAAFADWIAR